MSIIDSKIINGSAIAGEITHELADKVQLLLQRGIQPKLAIILVGNNDASSIYVRNKIKVANTLGIETKLLHLESEISQSDLHHHINELNNDTSVDAILMQLPLPSHINQSDMISSILPEKDVDGFHPVNTGYLHSGVNKGFIPCTPLGCLHLIHTQFEDLSGLNVAIIGRSNIVGKPLASLLTNHNATVTLCHSHTSNLAEITRTADIVITATGKAKSFGPQFFNAKSVVIDVGINKLDGHLCGDVDFDEVLPIVQAITPVPGGVGPMTIAYLMHNTIIAANNRHDSEMLLQQD